MKKISLIEFNNNIDKYFDLAINEQIIIQRADKETFVLQKQVCSESDDVSENGYRGDLFSSLKNDITKLFDDRQE